VSISVEAALEKVLVRCARLETESVGLLDALGRVIATDALSDVDVSPFDNSAMDGYAVWSEETASASEDSPVRLSVVDHIAAGDTPSVAVASGGASRIMTGAPMPDGADAVVMVEHATAGPHGGIVGDWVEIRRPAVLGENVRQRAEEVRAGDVVVHAGDVVGPAAVGLLAATGNATAEVYRRPRVAVISTGDELVDVGQKPGPGKIRNSNSYSIAAQVIAAGAVPLRFPTVPDDRDATREAFSRAAEESDFIVASGGVSVGDFDYVRPVLEELGELEFCRVAMRPGNPQTLGSINGVPFFGLPGNPTSTLVGFEVFVRPALRYMQGHSSLERPRVDARLTHDVRTKTDRRYYLRARIERGARGFDATLSGSQSSALLTAAHRGNCLLVLPEGRGDFPKGSAVEAMRLDVEEGTP
jgi:molybdopterin molybdotransferase